MSFEQLVSNLNDFAWGPVMLVLLVGVGVLFSFGTGFFQFRKFGYIIKNTLGKIFHKHTTEKGAVSPFQALTTAMAATVGTGNIVGVTGAIIIGGPGAVFWMWVSALFGMMTKYSEVVLAVKFRERNAKGDYVGGPMYYIKNGLGKKWSWLGWIFALLGALAAFGIGNMSQINAIATRTVGAVGIFTGAESAAANAPTIQLVVGIVIAVLVALVVFGGVKRIGKVTATVIPFMSLFYILGALVIIISNIDKIGGVFSDIFYGAFNPQAFIGGVAGAFFITLQRGVSRGVFSNEAGLGSAPIAHAATTETNPVKQGMYGVFEVFMDTIVICTMTSIVVLISGLINTSDLYTFGTKGDGGALTANSFSTVFGPGFSSVFIAIAILFFAGSTILAWQLYGERCFDYITKGKATILYRLVFLGAIVLGAVSEISLVWDISDTLNGFMAIPNLIALIALSGTVFKLTRDYHKEAILPELYAKREAKAKR